jgi:tripeptidyl-peptidase I
MRPSTIGLLFTLFATSFDVLAIPNQCAYNVKETVIPPHGWIKHNTPAPDHTIVLRIGLPQPNFNVLEKHLYEVSDPDHERYGAHLSKGEVETLVAPHQESVNLVDEWLQSHGIGENDLVRSPAKDWVTLRIPVSLAEKMLDTVCLNSLQQR